MTSNPRNDFYALANGPDTIVRMITDQIKPGMSRAQVEVLFQQTIGRRQGPVVYHHLVTIYHYDGGIKVEVPFNTYGGSQSEKNRVLGPVKVSIEDGEAASHDAPQFA